MQRPLLSALSKAISPFLILSALTCCGSTKETIDTSCAVFQPITFSAHDTQDTREQIITHDVKWSRLCGGAK